MSSLLDRHEFSAGDEGELNGIRWRIRQGRKSPDDLVLEIGTPEGAWRLVPLHLLALIVDFFSQNEPRVRPGYRSEKVIEHCKLAHRNGWMFASAVLDSEKTLARITPAPQLFDWEAEGVFEA